MPQTWEQRKFFDNVAETLDYRGKTPKKLGLSWNNKSGGYLALSAINVKNGFIDKRVETHFANKKLYEKWMGPHSLDKGDVLLTTEAPVGNAALVPDNDGYVLSQRVIAFKLSSYQTNNLFWLQYLQSPAFKDRIVAISSGGTAKGISQKSLKNIQTTIPSETGEQRIIGSTLITIDVLIAANVRQ